VKIFENEIKEWLVHFTQLAEKIEQAKNTASNWCRLAASCARCNHGFATSGTINIHFVLDSWRSEAENALEIASPKSSFAKVKAHPLRRHSPKALGTNPSGKIK